MTQPPPLKSFHVLKKGGGNVHQKPHPPPPKHQHPALGGLGKDKRGGIFDFRFFKSSWKLVSGQAIGSTHNMRDLQGMVRADPLMSLLSGRGGPPLINYATISALLFCSLFFVHPFALSAFAVSLPSCLDFEIIICVVVRLNDNIPFLALVMQVY